MRNLSACSVAWPHLTVRHADRSQGGLRTERREQVGRLRGLATRRCHACRSRQYPNTPSSPVRGSKLVCPSGSLADTHGAETCCVVELSSSESIRRRALGTSTRRNAGSGHFPYSAWTRGPALHCSTDTSQDAAPGVAHPYAMAPLRLGFRVRSSASKIACQGRFQSGCIFVVPLLPPNPSTPTRSLWSATQSSISTQNSWRLPTPPRPLLGTRKRLRHLLIPMARRLNKLQSILG